MRKLIIPALLLLAACGGEERPKRCAPPHGTVRIAAQLVSACDGGALIAQQIDFEKTFVDGGVTDPNCTASQSDSCSVSLECRQSASNSMTATLGQGGTAEVEYRDPSASCGFVRYEGSYFWK